MFDAASHALDGMVMPLKLRQQHDDGVPQGPRPDSCACQEVSLGVQANGVPPRPPPGMQGGPPPMPPMQNGFPGGPPGQVFPPSTPALPKHMPNAVAIYQLCRRNESLVGRSRRTDEVLVLAGFLKASTAAGCLPRIELLLFWQGQIGFQAMDATETTLATLAQAFCATGPAIKRCGLQPREEASDLLVTGCDSRQPHNVIGACLHT